MSYPQYGGFNGSPGIFNGPGRPPMQNQGPRISFNQRGPRPRGHNMQQMGFPPGNQENPFQQQGGPLGNPLMQNMAPFSANQPQPFFGSQPMPPGVRMLSWDSVTIQVPSYLCWDAFIQHRYDGFPTRRRSAKRTTVAADAWATFPSSSYARYAVWFRLATASSTGPHVFSSPCSVWRGASVHACAAARLSRRSSPPGPPTFTKDKRPLTKPAFSSEPAGGDKANPESVVTIFIGNIDERVSEGLMRALIGKCGHVANWKRVHGANNKLQAFGFCDFYDAESALRAIRLLDKVRLGLKELQVKIGNKQHPQIIAYQTVMRSRLAKDAPEDAVDDSTHRVDNRIRSDIDLIIEDHEEELSKILPEDKMLAVKRSKEGKDATIEEFVEMEEEKRQLISREIQNFRDTYKGSDEVLEQRIKEAGRVGRKTFGERGDSPGSVSGESVSAESRRPPARRSRSPTVVSSASSEDFVTLPARKRDTRRLAEQEKAYQTLLDGWLTREKRKAKERKADEDREKLKRAEEKKNAKRLIRVYEDYDDDKMDGEYYSGKALTTLLKDREKELEADQRDREREMKVLEELKEQLVREGHPKAEDTIKQLELEQNEHMISQSFRDALSTVMNEPVRSPTVKEEHRRDESVNREHYLDQSQGSTISFQQATNRLAKRVHGNSEMFGNSDDEGEREDTGERRKRLFRNDEEVERKRQVTEQKKVYAKKLIQNIPTKTDELFQYPVAWESLDKTLMESRVKPWISKKIQEYIGEEEQTLVEFIAQKVTIKANPRGIIQDISMVLDEDAEIFVMKLWRLLIFETEMKKAGVQTETSS